MTPDSLDYSVHVHQRSSRIIVTPPDSWKAATSGRGTPPRAPLRSSGRRRLYTPHWSIEISRLEFPDGLKYVARTTRDFPPLALGVRIR